MEVSVVHCYDVYAISSDLYDHYFMFPREWCLAESICIAGLWLSHEEPVTWLLLRYYQLHIDTSPLRIDENQNWISMFSVPVVVRKEERESCRILIVTTNREIVDFAVTFQWYPWYSDTDAISYAFFRSYKGTRPLQEDETIYIQLYKNGEIQPAEDMAVDGIMVSPSIIRIDGPCDMPILHEKELKLLIWMTSYSHIAEDVLHGEVIFDD